jgi:hypothetical protein
MIRFAMDDGRAIIFNDVGAENGWVVEYNSSSHKFLVWDNAERHARNQSCDSTFDTLEEVLKAVNSYT